MMGLQLIRWLNPLAILFIHGALMNVDAFDDATPPPAFGPRMVCTCCGTVGADTRPNWKERSEPDWGA
jgi:hypothetical protein